MALKQDQKQKIIETIKTCLREKFSRYSRETDHMPFHFRLLGRDRMALFSFIHSLNTTFGVSIYEPVAKELSLFNFKEVHTQFKLGNIISSDAQVEIQNIMNELSYSGEVNKVIETERIRKVATSGLPNKLKTVRVDLFLKSFNNEIFMFDLKTVKPNSNDFIYFKRNLLEWLALYFYEFPDSKVNTFISIPYNPYEPEPYNRWTMKGMLDLNNEVKVAEEFWDFLAGNKTYFDLLDCFEIAGIQLRPEIDNYFLKFK